MKRETRSANFELLRIVLMLLIIAGHVMMYSGKTGELGTANYYITNFLRSFTIVAVNSFVLITGYFGTKRNWKKLFALDLRVCFYTWVFFASAVALGIHSISITKDIQLIFPVVTKQYWYITIYFALCIFSPYLNVFLENVSEKLLRNAIFVGGGGLLYLIATFCFLINANQIVNDAGYGIVNFVYLYCLGYYIRHYYKDTHPARFYFAVYLVSCLAIFFVNAGMTYAMGFYFNSMMSYNTIFTLVGSVGLFMFFKNLNIKPNRFIMYLSKHSLSVYLMHMCPVVSSFAFTELMKVDRLDSGKLTIAIIVLPLLIYLVCTVIDSVVDYILNPIQSFCLDKVNNLISKASRSI